MPPKKVVTEFQPMFFRATFEERFLGSLAQNHSKTQGTIDEEDNFPH